MSWTYEDRRSINEISRSIKRLAEAEDQKANAMKNFNEKLDDFLTLGLLCLDVINNPNPQLDILNSFGNWRETLKNRK